MCPGTGPVGVLRKSTMCEWTRQAGFPVGLGVFQLSPVESRKSDGLNWQVGRSVVLRKDIQPGTTGWRRPGEATVSTLVQVGRLRLAGKRDFSKSSQPSGDWCPRLSFKATVPAITRGRCPSMPWALPQSVFFLKSDKISSLEPNPTEL